jgi:O-methyltransferase
VQLILGGYGIVMKRTSVSFLVSLAVLLGGAAGGAVVYVLQAGHEPASAKALPKVHAVIEAGTRARYPGAQPAPEGAVPLYLDLMKRSLTDSIYETGPRALAAKKDGRDWPSRAYTMLGFARLDSLQAQIEDVLRAGVPGDLIECGAWRGGATIFMRAVLKAHGVTDRKVWVSDSFEGLPPPDEVAYPADKGDLHSTYEALAVSLERVKDNFASYGLLDGQVEFLKGWFKDTLPKAKIERLAVLRVDGDMYESTMQALESLYAKVSPGGYVIVDDVGAVPGCKKAVEDFRAARHITAELKTIDWTGAYWRKQ